MGTPEQFSRQGHPRREAGPQSHGTPPESAGLPKDCHHARSLAASAIRGDQRDVEGLLAHKGRTSCPTRLRLKRARRAGVVLAVGVAFAASRPPRRPPPSISAPPAPFVVLAAPPSPTPGPSVLNGDLGVSPGTALVGFGLPAVVNGATHDNDAVARQAQTDLTTAYNVAAGQPVSPANDLTGTDLGNRTLTAGAYSYHVVGPAHGPAHPRRRRATPTRSSCSRSARTLTTASASSVVLINGASPCNVYWQVGSSATLGTTTAFQGNVMALTSHLAEQRGHRDRARCSPATARSRLINNVLDGATCGASTGRRRPSATGQRPSPAAARRAARPASRRRHSAVRPRRDRTARRPRCRTSCTAGFRATVRGRMIKRVVFSLDGKRIGSRTKSPFRVLRAAAGRQASVRARVTFKDATRAKTLTLRYRACAAAVRHPAPRPVAVHRMSLAGHRRPATPRPAPGGFGAGGGAARAAGAGCVLVAPAPAAASGARPASRSWCCCSDHVARTAPERARAPDRVRRRSAAADRRADRPPGARARAQRRRTHLGARRAPRAAQRAHGLDPRRPDQGARPPGGASSSSSRPAGSPSTTTAVSTAGSGRSSASPRRRRRGAGSSSRRPSRSVRRDAGGPFALATSARSERASGVRGRPRPDRPPRDGQPLGRVSGPPRHTAASGSARAPSPGWRGASAPACR